MFTLSIIYSSNFDNYPLLESSLDESAEKLKGVGKKIDNLVTLGHTDHVTIVEQYARNRGIPLTIIYPPKDIDGKLLDGAALIRNNHVVDAGDGIVCFQASGGSTGTSMMIEYVKKKGKKVRIVEFDAEPVVAKIRGELKQVELNYTVEIMRGAEMLYQETGEIKDKRLEGYAEAGAEMKAAIQAVSWAKKNSQKIQLDCKCGNTYMLVRHLFDKRSKEYDHDGSEVNHRYIKFVEDNKEWIEKWKVEK